MSRAGLKRRDLLRALAGAVFAPALLRGAPAQAALPKLPELAPGDALLLVPGDGRFAQFDAAYNRRTMLRPQLRALCRTPGGVAAMVDWARSNGVPFALRSGGHSYEGFCESSSIVIDTRLINRIEVDAANRSVTVGAGATLGDIYKAVGARGLAFSAGSCPTVGIAGHALGGGFGLLSRARGLACDNLQWLELADARGRIVTADRQQNPDLFWASRGGGGGTFGAATRFRFALHPVDSVVVFGVSWALPVERAGKLMQAWQAWAPHAPDAITSIMRINRRRDGAIAMHCAGQSIASEGQLRGELNALVSVERPPTPANIRMTSFLRAVDHFSGGWKYESTLLKGKSDYVATALGDSGVAALIGALARPGAEGITLICDSYGGALARTASEATAFAHRAGMLYSIQYYASWTNPGQTSSRLAQMKSLYEAMRPYMSGAAYVNYCDLDLADWAASYWGRNLARLRQIKAAFDPQDVFSHAQSVRPA